MEGPAASGGAATAHPYRALDAPAIAAEGSKGAVQPRPADSRFLHRDKPMVGTRARTLAVAVSLVMLTVLAGAREGHGALVTVEPDAFAIGTNLRTAVEGVTLSVVGTEGAITSRPVLVRSGFDGNLGRNLATTGSMVFGQPIDFSLPLQTGQHWDEGTFGLLRADFDQPTDFVQVDLVYGDDTIALLKAFDADNNLLAEVIESGDGRTADAFDTASISRVVPDIAYVLAGGVSREATFLDNLQFNRTAVPEPGSFALLVAGLVGLGLAGWRVERRDCARAN